jgi:hypothetical protein
LVSTGVLEERGYVMNRRLAWRSSGGAAVAIALLAAVPAAAAAPVSFTPYQTYPVGSRPESVGIADVTGDGRADVLLATSFGSDPDNDFKLFAFPQMPDGTLGAPLKYSTHAQYYSIGLDTGDLNGDSRTDVVVATTSGVDVFYQAAGGGLLPAQLIATSNQAFGVEVADVDTDGDQDIVTNTRDGVFWLEANAGDFATHLVTTDPQWEVEVGDLTGDRLPDIAGCSGLVQCGQPIVNVFAQRGNGAFRARQYPANSNGWSGCGIGVGDVTGDDRDDVTMSICANRPNALLNVFPQVRGKLATPVVYSSYDIPEPIVIADMNGDNLGDAVTLHGGWMQAGVYLQEASALSPESLFSIPYASHYGPEGLAVGDINSDGKPDIAEADYTYGLVVLRQL